MSIATEPDALARDSELLSSVLHEVLVEQAGEELARSVQWLHYQDAEPHLFPNCGLVDVEGKIKPAHKCLRHLRRQYLR